MIDGRLIVKYVVMTQMLNMRLKMSSVVYVCEKCSMIISRTSHQITFLIKKYGGIFCKRCIKGWYNGNKR